MAKRAAIPELAGYFGVFAPAGDAEVDCRSAQRRIREGGAADPKVQEFYKISTLVWESNTPEQFAAFAKADRKAATKVFESLGVQPQDSP